MKLITIWNGLNENKEFSAEQKILNNEHRKANKTLSYN